MSVLRLISGKPAGIEAEAFPLPLRAMPRTFVTLEIDSELRGCVGSLTAHPLVADVAANKRSSQTYIVPASGGTPQLFPGDGPDLNATEARWSPDGKSIAYIAGGQLWVSDAKGANFVEGAGCVECNNTGYRGRQGVYEVMTLTSALRELVLDRASASELKKLAVQEGMLTLRRDALEKLKRGLTTVEEVLKETSADKQ